MELRDYLKVIRIRKAVILQAVLIVTLTAIVVSLLLPQTFSGEAKVLIQERDTGAALFGMLIPELSSQPERSLQTQVQLMQLRPLAEETIRKLGLQTTPSELLSRVTVSAVGQTNVVTVTATDSDPARAAAIANTMAEEFVEWSRSAKRESISAAAEEVEVRLDEAREEILELGRRIDAQGRSDDLAAELAIATGTYTTLAEKLEQLRINEQLEVGSGRVVQPAIEIRTPISPKPVRNGLLGFAVGLVFGLGMAFLYEYLDNTIKSTEEAERLYGAPVLGMIPAEKAAQKGAKRRLTIIDSPGSAIAEAYRVLRNSLDFINFEHDMKTLMVTSAAPGEGKSTVASNFAASLAQSGKRVVLISCDFRRPTTHHFFDVNNMIGLSDVLTGAHPLKTALQRPGSEELYVLTAGKMPPNPSELLGSEKMSQVIESLEEWADWVIVDTPPLLAVADPASAARWVDGVLVVMQAHQSTREAASKASELLGKVGARTVGVVLWDLDESKGAVTYGYYTGGYYYYASYYGAGPAMGASPAQGEKGGRSAAVQEAGPPEWTPPVSLGRRVASFVWKLLVGVLAFSVVIAIAGLVTYFVDQYFGWGLLDALTAPSWLRW